MERITRADVDRIAATVSEGLAEGYSVRAQARNGYIGLDLYGPVPGEQFIGLLDGPLHAGTKREVYTYLQGMRRAHLLRRKGE